MDPVSQAVLGAACAESTARRQQMLAAAICGLVAGMAADLDILIRSDTDPLLGIEFHRHFTHSLLFAPFGALVIILLLYPVMRRWLGFGVGYGFCCLGFASHGLLDACTSYGTQLLWPFSNARIAFDIVSVIDPLFTLPLLALCVLAVLRRRALLGVAGLAWALAYLGLGAIQHQRAAGVAAQLAAERGHAPAQIGIKPSFGNILLWKTIYEDSGIFYIDAVRVAGGATVFVGESRPRLDLRRDFPWLDADSRQYRDVERFSWFASGFLALDPQNRNRIVDLRYSLVPNRADSFWGIELDPAADPDAHVAYVTMRARTVAEGRELLGMVFQGDRTQ